jgi:hypothetical protein
MNKNFLGATLFITSLLLNPLTVSSLNANSKVQLNSLSLTVSTILHKRGLDEDVAQKATKQMIGEDEELFTNMLKNLIIGCEVLTQDEVLEYLSMCALFKEEVRLDSYSHLVKMVQKIKSNSVNKKTLAQLQNIQKKNLLYFHGFIA